MTWELQDKAICSIYLFKLFELKWENLYSFRLNQLLIFFRRLLHVLGFESIDGKKFRIVSLFWVTSSFDFFHSSLQCIAQYMPFDDKACTLSGTMDRLTKPNLDPNSIKQTVCCLMKRYILANQLLFFCLKIESRQE